jgi:hypothetical protein
LRFELEMSFLTEKRQVEIFRAEENALEWQSHLLESSVAHIGVLAALFEVLDEPLHALPRIAEKRFITAFLVMAAPGPDGLRAANGRFVDDAQTHETGAGQARPPDAKVDGAVAEIAAVQSDEHVLKHGGEPRTVEIPRRQQLW